MIKSWHALTVDEVMAEFGTSANGLDESVAKESLVKYGLNKLKEKETVSPWKILVAQFQGMLVYLLFGAGILSFLVGEYIDGAAILAILLLNGVLGFFQEYKAEKAMEALKSLESPSAKVTRNGRDMVIPAEELVPGDMIIINEGDKIPADARVIEAFSLEVEEAILTGESRPVKKTSKILSEKLVLSDRVNLIYSGTIATKGRAKALVYATGMETEVGHIATLVSESEETETPLQQTMEKLGKILGLICIAIAVPGLILGIVKGREVIEMVMTSISLAVSAIPEGLPVVVTIALALGTRRMVKRGVLIRKLPAVEALGSTDVICSDKTGTITHNKMTVTDLWLPRLGLIKTDTNGTKTTYHITAKDEYRFGQKIEKSTGDLVDLEGQNDWKWLIRTGVLCNDSGLNYGDPTEKALIILGENGGLTKSEVDKNHPRLDEVPFDSATKYMLTLNQVDESSYIMAKGAPEVILNACSHVRLGNELIALDDRMRQQIIEYNEKLSAKALRVLAMAYKPGETSDMKQMSDFIFQGLVGMIDPPRAEVKEAIKICHQAGIRVIMITGDHPLTAKAIADEIGLSSTKVVTGMELDTLTDPEISELVENETVFARVSPEHKLTILRQLQKNKHLVAMTGDGVNDAPALKEANIGIAVGSGSDLAKEVSDMILLDDNFATIASAVEEGRGIFFNIRKFVKFLIAANFDEILVIFTSILFGTPLPFLPIHLLWLNLATDSLPALALSLDSYQKGIMRLKPYDPRKEIMHGVLKFSVVAGVLAYFATMGIFSYGYFIHNETIRMAQTMAFSTTVLFEFFIVFSCRSDISAFMAGIFSNKFLLASIAIGLAMQAFAVYFPYTHDVFKTIALDGEHAVEMVFAAASGFILIETFRGVKYALAWKKQV